MSFVDVLISLFEVCLVVFTLWALFHEDRLIAFEERLISNIRRKRLRVVRESHGIKEANAFIYNK